MLSLSNVGNSERALLLLLVTIAALSVVICIFYYRYSAQQVQSCRDDCDRQVGTARQDVHVATLRLGEMQATVERLTDELCARPGQKRVEYPIVTLGYSGAGKTVLTKRWVNPIFDIKKVGSTRFDHYYLRVANVRTEDSSVEHIFEFMDWGGENIADAIMDLGTTEVSGMLIVVDLASADTGDNQIDTDRVIRQLEEFNIKILNLLFCSKTLAQCKVFVLFINKVDRLTGTAAQIEERVETAYKPLIDNIRLLGEKRNVDVRVIIGSAAHGNHTTDALGYLIQRVLPQEVIDQDPNLRQYTTPVRRSTTAGGTSGSDLLRNS